jgi:hypothetical protein
MMKYPNEGLKELTQGVAATQDAAYAGSEFDDLRRQMGELQDCIAPPPPYLHKLIMGRVEMDFVPAEYQRKEEHAMFVLGIVFIPSIAFCLYMVGVLFSGAFLGGPRMLPFFRLALTGGDLFSSIYRVFTRLPGILAGQESLIPAFVVTIGILIVVYFTGHWAGNREVKSC